MIDAERANTEPTAPASSEARRFIERLEREVHEHRALEQPYLLALAGGYLPDPVGAPRDHAHQYFTYSTNFQRYLTATVSQLDEPEHRRLLLANLLEESHGVSPEEDDVMRAHGIELEGVEDVPHPVLYRRYLDALSMDEAWLHEHPFSDEAVLWSQLYAPGELVHRQVGHQDAAEDFSRSLGHPVYEEARPSRAVSFSLGELAPGQATSNHRHAYESLYVPDRASRPPGTPPKWKGSSSHLIARSS